MRRVVTGHKDGKSVILEDKNISGNNFLGYEIFELWETIGIPTIPIYEENLKKQLATRKIELGEIRVRFTSVEPDKIVLNKAKEKGVNLEKVWRETFADEFQMHTTDTIDYDIVLSGEIWMEVDDGKEVHLEPLDCVVQNGTRHAWRNRSNKPCVLATIMVGAKRK